MSLPPYLKPGDKVVLYDQHCRFCTLWSGFLARRADHRLKLLAAQSAEGLAILDWFGLAPDHFDTWLFVDGAYACDDNDALLEVLRLLPGPWRHLRWLRLLADRGDWKTFVNYYDPKLNFTELDCLYGQYQLGHGQKAEGYATSERLWLVGKSQPAACDTLFGLWQGEGQLTEEKVWKRLKLAAEARNYSLASHLAQRLPTLGNQGALMVSVAQNPAQLSQTGRFSQRDHATADVVGLGLRRLARQDPEKALSLLDYYSSALPFSSDEKVAIAREIGLSLAKRFDPRALPLMTQYDPGLRDNTVTELSLIHI